MSAEPLIVERGHPGMAGPRRPHYLHPFTDFKSLAAEGSRVIARAEGVYLYDTEGNRNPRRHGGLWCVNVGYGRRELADAAFRQMQELPYYTASSRAPTAGIELARRLAELTARGSSTTCSSPRSGSEARLHILRMGAPLLGRRGEPQRQVTSSAASTRTTAAPWPARARWHVRHALAGRPADPRRGPHRAARTGSRRRGA